jgi:glyoxylase-like metal-dependent hydrolase (beta-lactamase superfamily II)
LLHPADIEVVGDPDWKATLTELFRPLGFDDELLARFLDEEGASEWEPPSFSAMNDGDVFGCGDARLRVEHHAGHTPGHAWIIEERSGAIFAGDYLIANHPTNAGLEVDRSETTGRARMLALYNEGLRELMERDAPVLFAGHGPPIVGHRDLIARRLKKTDRRTRHVLGALDAEPRTALDVARRLYGSRPERSWEVMADVTGRLDLLVEQGRARSRMGEDGVWYFQETGVS